MIEYVIIFILCIINALMYKKTKNKKDSIGMIILIFITFMAMFLIQAFRYDVGTDFLGSYTNEYYKVLYGNINKNLDIGFYFIYKIIIMLSLDKQWIFIISSFIFNIFVVLDIYKRSDNPTISTLIYFLGTFFFFSMNGIRQSIAASIFYYSLKYIEEKNFKKYLLFNIIGSVFHGSALLFIPLYFLVDKELSTKKRVLLIICSILSLNLIMPKILDIISMTKYRNYLIDSRYNLGGKFSLSSIVNLFIYLFLEFNSKCVKKDKKYNMFINLHFIGVLLSILSVKLVIIFRLFLSFRFVEILSIPYFIKKMNNYKAKNKLICYIYIFSIYILYFIYAILIKNYNDTIPYKSIFFR